MKKPLKIAATPRGATLPQPRAEVVTPPILASAPAILDDIKNCDRRFHEVNVRQDGENFRLWNGEAPAGERLIKGEGFPLEHSDVTRKPWESGCFVYSTLEAATRAAAALQMYLDCYENPKLEAELNRRAKDADYIAL